MAVTIVCYIVTEIYVDQIILIKRVYCTVVWDATPCSPVQIYLHFGGIYCLCLQEVKVILEINQQ
jgi:hypothetical protein